MTDFTVNSVIETLGSLLVQETKLLGCAKKEVESIKSELDVQRKKFKASKVNWRASDLSSRMQTRVQQPKKKENAMKES
ncbi:hypothetical protein Patl1_03863 [Pistacia atlantica]|uniref:Uncharacterized protein n=1 Tax=Pistacia atlantica TaxID=434234 RepID=A0ACC1BT84_9ROSI|nr:hypothetical protein Patl1_03863 [Pistacia atlantica]